MLKLLVTDNFFPQSLENGIIMVSTIKVNEDTNPAFQRKWFKVRKSDENGVFVFISYVCLISMLDAGFIT